MRTTVKWAGAAVLMSMTAMGAAGQELNLMPWPAKLEAKEGSFSLAQWPRIQVKGGDARVEYAVAHLSTQLTLRTGMPAKAQADVPSSAPVIAIECAGRGAAVQQMGEDEAYTLVATPGEVRLKAGNPLGVLRGVETILQLVQSGKQGWYLPAMKIEDAPRFPWRGLMIDVSRHFMSVDDLKRNLDGMAAVKLNVLHIHLSDDEGIRIESKLRPNLQKIGSAGQFYTQAQIKEIVAYARQRGIRVMPEFDVPGHSVSWSVSYRKLASGEPAKNLVRGMEDSNRPTLDPTSEYTYQTLNAVFGEMAALFPDRYFHIGGDEVDGKYWDKNPKIQAWMKAHRIVTNQALQAYFNKRVQKILAQHGKRMVGWDEILSPELPKGTVVQSWRGPESLAQSAKLGYQTILSAGWYLDLMFPAAKHYAVEPLSGDAAKLTPEEQKLILGGEAAQWAEFVTPEVLDNRVWPRMGAIAERLWSPATVTDADSMYRRLGVLSQSLEWNDLRHKTNPKRMMTRLAGATPVKLLENLAVALEPVKEYQRGETQPYAVYMPLNHMVDAIPPESDVAREFNGLAQWAVKDAQARTKLRAWLTLWRENDAQLEPYLANSPLTQNLSPLSRNLAAVATLGLAALDSIEKGTPVSDEQKTQQIAALEKALAPAAEMQIMIGPGVKQLIESQPKP